MSYTEKALEIANGITLATSYLTDDQAESVTILFPNWEVGVLYSVGDRRQYDGLLYRCVQDS